MAGTREEAEPGRQLTRAARAGAAMVPAGIGLACAALLTSQAEGAEAPIPAAVFSFGLAGVGFAIGLATYFILRSASWWPVMVVIVWTVGLAGVTVLLALPRAPTGADHSEGALDGTYSLQQEVESLLDDAVPGRWSVEYDSTPLVCRDWLGRQRGAARSEFKIGVKPAMTMEDLDHLSDGLRRAGWEVESSQSTVSAQTDRYVHATRVGYQVNAHAASGAAYSSGGDGSVYASTPCLHL